MSLCHHVCPDCKLNYCHPIRVGEPCLFLTSRPCGQCKQPSLDFPLPIKLDYKTLATGEKDEE